MKRILTLFILLSVIITTAFTRYIYATSHDNLIIIDAGHGGDDGGSIGDDNTLEKDINLQITLHLKDIFEENGFNVLLTRDGDYDLSNPHSTNKKREDIHKRVAIINKSGAKLYLSIHANYYPNEKIFGSQVFYKKDDDTSKVLGILIQKSLTDYLKNTTRQAKEIYDKYLIDNAIIPGVLIEVGFLSNDVELRNLKDETYQKKLSEAIYFGVINYLNFKQK